MAHAKENKIIVNGTEHTVPDDTLKFDQIVEIAFPGHPNDPNAPYLVTFEKAQSKPHEGALAAGGKVEVKHNGTTFDVTPTNRS